MKTCLYNFDPLKPHFYIVKLGFTGVYIIFLISVQNIDCGYSLGPPRRGGSNEYPQSMFSSRNMKNIRIFYLEFFFFGGKIFSMYLNKRVFVMFIYKAIMLQCLFAFTSSITKTRLFKYIENFTTKKRENFQIKHSEIFHISDKNIDCGYSLEPPRSEIRKIMYTPVNPSFTI